MLPKNMPRADRIKKNPELDRCVAGLLNPSHRIRGPSFAE
ncbi:hypothetical protein SAXI111661_08780 [Saccharomonospora xinjiangensis]|uniref:Uncharacterized protein n=1 Tax=Saccharomonospora xinjiangensis XJ-54 TaxID=882086 RepID=I0V5C4_9PSEU|nr:hypothetical protein SacxiDRAFT_3118 [Saccharomonospora xinjiangensis XJ-54]QBQ61714.1 hypothetical protein EYD13_16850 [Saccharomonospora xinjiangensis]